jgi:hypothetical protein
MKRVLKRKKKQIPRRLRNASLGMTTKAGATEKRLAPFDRAQGRAG